MHAKAIAYAQNLCAAHLAKLSFVCRNAFRYSTDQRFDLVWSAGLFDYFDDRGFVALLTRLRGLAKPGAEVVIGNFAEGNPTLVYQEFCEWSLNHRSHSALQGLAEAAGFAPKAIRIEQEPEGINLFLRATVI